MALISIKCPKCKVSLQFEEDEQSGTCQYCGCEITIQKEFIRTQGRYPLEGKGTYEGPLDEEGRPHGVGEFVWRDGSWYAGDFVHGKIEGKGKMTYSEDNWYEGDFVNYLREGNGTLVDEKATYEGEWKNDLMNGHGKVIHADGSVFTGEFVDGEESVGTEEGSDEDGIKWKYYGEFKDGAYNGEGIITWDIKYSVYGHTYRLEGHFEDGSRKGLCKVWYSNGGKYAWQYGNLDGWRWDGEVIACSETVVWKFASRKYFKLIYSKGRIQESIKLDDAGFVEPEIAFDRIKREI